MIVIKEEKPEVVFLKVILGPTSNMQMNYDGSIMIDISDYLEEIADSGKPCLLKVNCCNNEQELLQYINHQKMIKELQNDVEDEVDELMNGAPNKTSKHNKTKKPECPSCRQPAKGILIDGKVYPCKECELIDSNTDTKYIIPDEEELAKIRSSIDNIMGGTNDECSNFQ